VVLAYLVVSYVLVTNLMRTRDGRALVAVRDHYLSAEIMGINLTKYRTLSFGLAAFFAGIAGRCTPLSARGLQRRLRPRRSILFLAMVSSRTGSVNGHADGHRFSWCCLPNR